ncbi:tyrosine-type recombinase/integrase [Mycolicibacterium conceptionense]|uniref:tyrosine-type recombinase/integrase n=1 Tax=Mycolicibacterium conceptionense TaxID=451644 RepID=UPI001F314A07|nr:tyrosine-type recombinase/integrase [Mycolicibacterium conceptionense]
MSNEIPCRPLNTGKPKAIPDVWEPLISGYLNFLKAGDHPKTTINTRRSHLARMSRGLQCLPSEVTEDILLDWFGRQTHWATETRRSYRTTLRDFFRWAYQHKHLSDDFTYTLPRVKARKPMPRPTPEPVRQTARDDADPRVFLMLELADVGMRRGEVAAASTHDLITEGPQLVVHGKGNKRRVIPITDKLATRIAAGAAGHTPGAPTSGYLFPGNDNGHLSPRWVGTLCSRVMPGVWTMHSLRHRTATRAYDATHDIVAIKELLGHDSIATTQMYTLVQDDKVRLAMLAAVS